MAKSYSTLLPSADVQTDEPMMIKVNAKTLIGGAAVAAFALGALAATAVAPAAPSAPAAFYNRHGVPAEARREQMDRGDALNWHGVFDGNGAPSGPNCSFFSGADRPSDSYGGRSGGG